MSFENIFVFNPNTQASSDQLNINFNTARSCFRLLGTGEATPSQITSNQNDYTTLDAANNNPIGVLRLSTDASRNITGFSNGATGRRLLILNVGSFDIVLKHQDGGSTAINRIITKTGGDLTVTISGNALLYYDSTTERWRVL